MAYECSLFFTAMEFLDTKASQDDRKEIFAILDEICLDPFPDARKKFYFVAAPLVFTICRDARWWVVYHIHNGTTIHVFNIGSANEKPNIRRS